MPPRKRSQSQKAQKAQEAPEQPTTEEVYAGYSAPAVPDQVEVRINGKIVFLNTLYNASVDVQASGVKVNGSSDAPKGSTPKKAEPELYNPAEQESAASSPMAPVPATDPEYTEALDESATPDDDER